MREGRVAGGFGVMTAFGKRGPGGAAEELEARHVSSAPTYGYALRGLSLPGAGAKGAGAAGSGAAGRGEGGARGDQRGEWRIAEETGLRV